MTFYSVKEFNFIEILIWKFNAFTFMTDKVNSIAFKLFQKEKMFTFLKKKTLTLVVYFKYYFINL